jgi:hypothetical protein
MASAGPWSSDTKLSPARRDLRYALILRRRLYLNDKVGQGPGPRRRRGVGIYLGGDKAKVEYKK